MVLRLLPPIRMFFPDVCHEIFAVFERDVALTTVEGLGIVRAVLQFRNDVSTCEYKCGKLFKRPPMSFF